MKLSGKKAFGICGLLALFCIVIVFTPLLTPYYQISPQLFGMPYSLWTGILATIFLVALTYLAGKFVLKTEEEDES
jgi:hypothetical protein